MKYSDQLPIGRKIFKTEKALEDWLKSPAPALDGVRPIDLLDTQAGVERVNDLLTGMAYGNYM